MKARLQTKSKWHAKGKTRDRNTEHMCVMLTNWRIHREKKPPGNPRVHNRAGPSSAWFSGLPTAFLASAAGAPALYADPPAGYGGRCVGIQKMNSWFTDMIDISKALTISVQDDWLDAQNCINDFGKADSRGLNR